MNAAQRALSTFRQPPYMHTCAQTICAAFGREDLLEDMKKQSGGRADGGTCGALHAAMHLAGDDAPQIEEAFRTALGATRCRELKGGDPPVPCQLCVKTAAELLEKLFESKA
ncbi:MAG TPA: C-GCAxxG-C-C family protein [Candidatus Akkermansia intestinigallinarum]|uniref:C-GCAxxG-C-C family protein n=1 Tax=Candidatus Akkermansia intestinigallinarum TaxID=2838431 RepID=A0A9D1VB28_9BACT|nr:C-GCAxxG-C-C family protein [Candidatus Akkermansia intestinigallinarum]